MLPVPIAGPRPSAPWSDTTAIHSTAWTGQTTLDLYRANFGNVTADMLGTDGMPIYPADFAQACTSAREQLAALEPGPYTVTISGDGTTGGALVVRDEIVSPEDAEANRARVVEQERLQRLGNAIDEMFIQRVVEIEAQKKLLAAYPPAPTESDS